MRVITVCTGNLCRSPLVEQALRARLVKLPAAQPGALTFESFGTHAEPGQPMPEPAARWSLRFGGDPSQHASAFLSEASLRNATLVLAMEREHRARVVSLAPTLLRRTFTLREFARLADRLDDEAIAEAVTAPLVGGSPSARLAAALGALADVRGIAPMPENPADDDVVDPYRRSEATYALAAEQMRPGIEAVARLIAHPALWQD